MRTARVATMRLWGAMVVIFLSTALGYPLANPRGASVVAAAGIPSHVLTLTYLGGYDAPRLSSYAQAGPWTTWALTGLREARSVADAGIKTIWYTNPNRVSSKDPTRLYDEDETMFAHDCNGQRIRVTKGRGDERYLTDPTSPKLVDRWRKAAQNHHFSALFDDTADNVAQGLSAKPCNFDQDDWTKKNIALITALNYPVIYNELAMFRKEARRYVGLSPAIGLNAAPNAIGGELEGCYVTYERREARVGGTAWSLTEGTQLQMARDGKLFVCLSRAKRKVAAEDAIDYRLYTYASFLLSFDLRTSMLAEPFYTSASGINVMPEVALVPTDPMQKVGTDVNVLRTSTGAYGREYAQCYIGGSALGACATVVNSDEDAHSFPYKAYKHTLVLSGAGVTDGGSAQPTGPPPPASIPPLTGIIAFK